MSDELPHGWATASLREIAEARMGETILAKQLTPTGVPVFSAGQENNPWGFLENPRKPHGKGTVVVSARGSIGFPKIPKAERFASTQTTIALRFPDEEFAAYACLWLKTVDWAALTKGGAIPMLTVGDINELLVPLAPPAEQRRIVAKLETLLGKVDASEQRLAKIPVLLKRFRQSVLAAACSGRLTADWREENPTDDVAGDTDLPPSWKSAEFGELISDGPQNGLYKPASFYGDGIMIVRIDAFYDGTIAAWGELKRVRLTEKERNQFALRNDDILVNRVNSPKFLGKCALVRKLKEPCVYESNMMRLRLDTSRALPDYAILYLQSLPGLVELRKNAKHAVNQSSINQEDVKGAMFNLPPLPEQQEIVRRVEGLFALADQLEERLAKARGQVEKLTPSLLARAFAGQLVPQDPTDEPAAVLLEKVRPTRSGK